MHAMSKVPEYRIPAGAGEAVLVEKRSRFIGRVWPVESEEEALLRIGETREAHPDASHNVYAYALRGGRTRHSDDGEPQGTSGLPTLNVLLANGIVNACCVVTRYYGGILLGAGGLVRAYSATAKEALDQAGISVMRQWSVMLLACPYALFEQMKQLVAAAGGLVESSDYGVDVMLEVLVPLENAGQYVESVLNASSGTVRPEPVETVFRGVRLISG